MFRGKAKTSKAESRNWQRRYARRGGAVVEMAIVSPLLLMMLLGIVEFGYVFMVQQTLTNGVREACRTAALAGTITDDDIRNRFQQAIAPTGITVTPGMLTITHATTLNPVETVRATVPYSQVTLLGILPSGLFSGFFCGGGSGEIGSKMVGASCSMRKEGAI